MPGPAPASRLHSPDTIEGFTAFALQQGWSDGLPLVPPTEERVAAMVAASGRPGGDMIGYMEPSGGRATVEKVAANAVMAGCLPEYMPVVLAALEAALDPRFNLHTLLTTTTGVAPALVINGPARHTLGINCSYGALGPGWQANATIGRAFRLIAMNIGGAKPGPIDRSLLGLPAKYTFCFGEAEEESPWEPLHVERGFARADNTVTLVNVQSTTDVSIPYKEAEDMLCIIAATMGVMGVTGVFLGDGDPLLILTPGQASLLHRAGWSKRSVKEWLHEHSKIPVDRFPTGPAIVQYHKTWTRRGDFVYVTRGPERIVVVVAGGAEPYHAVYCAQLGAYHSITKRFSSG